MYVIIQHRTIALLLLFCIFNHNLFSQTRSITEGKYTYETVDNDPLNARIYTLSNGLKVYMSPYNDEPRIQTYIAVRTGSKNDPADATGLAHYLEHMLFKGTDIIGTQNWEGEKILLEKISNLYEEYRITEDTLQRKIIYAKIDSLSGVAAFQAIPNEYDKMISSIGAIGTNAYTSLEQTVYVNNIPSNELEKWIVLESERMEKLVLRLFHTELEAVYEEFNIGQDDDNDKVYETLLAELFKNHTYGTQTTIGKGEHLKNPSMRKIHEYYNTYYVPNNIAICMSGDLDPQKTIELIDKHFGSWKSKPVPQYKFEKEKAIAKPIIRNTYGSQAEMAVIGFRFGGEASRDALMMRLIDGLLTNGRAGLIDLNINQQQKLLSASSGTFVLKDYSLHILDGNPREGQSLEDVKNILLQEIEKVKKGEFDDWLIPAVINDLKLAETKAFEHNNSRAHSFVDAFIWEIKWEDHIKRIQRMSQIPKQEIIDFANKHYNDNYVVVYKNIGVDTSTYKVQKPQITPVTLNRDTQSIFLKYFTQIKPTKLEPVFLDYTKDITEVDLNKNIKINYLKNHLNNTFNLYYIFEMGSNNDKKLELAIKYLPYLGTTKYTSSQLQQEFFKLGITFDVYSSEDRTHVSLSGLETSIEEGIKLFEHILTNVKPDNKALSGLKKGIIKKREDAKLNKRVILWDALFNYGKFGSVSAFTNILNKTELNKVSAKELVSIIKNLTSYKHKVFYYGTKSIEEIKSLVTKLHITPQELKNYPPPIIFNEQTTDKGKVYLVHYDMVQAEIIMLSKSDLYHKDWEPYISIYNEYYGRGLSSIVFQEIRESRALAYSAFATFSKPDYVNKSHYIYGYIGTQLDKMKDAITAFTYLMNNMPVAPQQFIASQNAITSKIESDRITKTSIFWNYESAKRKNIDYDIRKDIYNKVKSMPIEDLVKFHEENIKSKPYTYLILGNKNKVDLNYLRTLGTLEIISLEEIFRY